MSRDDLDHIPSIVPSREGSPSRGGAGRDSASRRSGQAATSSGAGWLARLFITLALVAAAVACAWAWQLQQELQQANAQLSDYAARIGDLEARLSDTDEGMNQNAAVQAVKIAELDSEVRKLWDNVWKKSKAQIAKLQSDSKRTANDLKSAQSAQAENAKALQAIQTDLSELKGVAGDMSRLMTGAKASQAEVERVADTLNRISLDINKLNKRVAENEEWVGSINTFRKQVNASLSTLQSQLQSLRAPATAP